MSDLEPRSLGVRVVATLPVFSALWLYGYAHERWLLVAPLALALAIAIALRVTIQRRPWHLIVAIVLGASLGSVFLWGNSDAVPISALPPNLLSSICGALACLAFFVMLTEREMWAWVYAWLLAGFCLNVEPVGAIWFPFSALIVSTLACCFVLGGAVRLGRGAIVAFVVFVALMAGTAYGLARAALGSERALVSAADRWGRDVDLLNGLGLKSDVNLAQFSNLEPSSRPIFELDGKVPDYLRTMVMARFDGVRWTPDPKPNKPAAGPAVPSPESQREMGVTFYESLDDVIPAPAGTYDVTGTRVRYDPGWIWRATDRTVRSDIRVKHGSFEQLPPEAPPGPLERQLPAYLAHGDLRTQLRPLALEIVGDAKSPEVMADRIEQFFHANFLYSLKSDLRGPAHPLVTLIKERRPTYCVYFASAMAALLRSLDVSTRLVTGFLPSESNPVNGRTIVRVRDAHAWVEVYVPERGRYVSYDPTPSRSREDLLGLNEHRSWIQNVFAAIGSTLRRAWLKVKQDPVGFIFGILRSPFVAGPAGILAAWYLWRRRQIQAGPAMRRALESEDAQLRAAHRRYLRLLSRAGVIAGRAETDDDLLTRLSRARGPEAQTAATAFISSYRRARYAGADQQAELPGLLGRLETALRASRAPLARGGSD